MEFEIDEFALAAWMAEECIAGEANHAPGWAGEHGTGQTGEWIPEEGRGLTAKRLEPVE